jgi:choline kinase
MKIIILAAGIGSRLGNPFPKPLTPLKNGKSIMQMQTEHIASKYNIDDINVVVGFKKELIMERFPELSYIYNPFFDRTNTSKSLLQALKKNRHQSVLWFNGDVVFDEKILDLIDPHIEANTSFVAVNTSKVADEEVKYTIKNGYIEQLSKNVKNGLGEAVGINFISSNDIVNFIERLEECDDNDYFERGLELAIKKDNLKIIN